jgi:hypothetical protein
LGRLRFKAALPNSLEKASLKTTIAMWTEIVSGVVESFLRKKEALGPSLLSLLNPPKII